MSLPADVFVTDESGGCRLLDVPEGSSDLAGFERRRSTLWGSPAVRSLGARFLPRLAEGDLDVAPAEVAEFTEEVLLLLGSAESLAARMDPPGRAGQIAARLDNILDAARRAARVGGGVRIW
ncbi:hypothetical protein ACIQOW_30775 [Kitasatospora sp. NPDC091335]|uniref:hypothetical protein n=1 Tax=Kitasatospora sp. NPDC091335 TaxID=3364085 RepID=UPI003817E6F2